MKTNKKMNMAMVIVCCAVGLVSPIKADTNARYSWEDRDEAIMSGAWRRAINIIVDLSGSPEKMDASNNISLALLYWNLDEKSNAIQNMKYCVEKLRDSSREYGVKGCEKRAEILLERMKKGKLMGEFDATHILGYNRFGLQSFIMKPVLDAIKDHYSKKTVHLDRLIGMIDASTDVYRKEGQHQAKLATFNAEMDYLKSCGDTFDPNSRPPSDSPNRANWDACKRIYDIYFSTESSITPTSESERCKIVERKEGESYIHSKKNAKMCRLCGGTGKKNGSIPDADTLSRLSPEEGREFINFLYHPECSACNGKGIVPAHPKPVAKSDERFKTGDTKTITLPGGATMEMIYCAPGSFMMGSPASEEGRYNDETQHHVTLTKGFWLGKYEVTQEQWQSVMGDNPSHFKGSRNPVDQVSWEDCNKFIEKVNARLNCGARLPTEAEWEYACRAGTTTAYFWGNALNGDKANCNGGYPCGTTTKGRDKKQTTPVGSYDANAWGFCDMHGNVKEWCNDWYDEHDYSNSPVTNPSGPTSGGKRVIRGGGWGNRAKICRSANRDGYSPDDRYYLYGFRLCCAAGLCE